jgi:hypothetical protein
MSLTPIYIAHRINTLEELAKVPSEYGIEIDIRDELLVVHDPFTPGIQLEDLLKRFHHRFIILNIKCERIEYKIMDLLSKYNITDYFFLDSSFPMIYKLTSEGNKNVAIRYSEFEHSILEMKGRCDWIWVDSFNDTLSLSASDYQAFKEAGFKMCFVSPELHGFSIESIDKLMNEMRERGMVPDMICTKVYNIPRYFK